MLKCLEDAMSNSNGNRSNLNGTEVFDMLLFHSFYSFWYDFTYFCLVNLDRFRLLLLAGALEINIKLHENKQVISFPPCPCVPSAKQTLEIVRSEGCYSLLVPVSFLAGEYLFG